MESLLNNKGILLAKQMRYQSWLMNVFNLESKLKFKKLVASVLLSGFVALLAACGGGGGGAVAGENGVATAPYDAPASSLTAIQYKN
jgi:hypothetical protein